MVVKSGTETGTSVDQSEAAESGKSEKKQKFPQRGKRYSPAEKALILKEAKDSSVAESARKYGVASGTIYEWRRADKRRNKLTETQTATVHQENHSNDETNGRSVELTVEASTQNETSLDVKEKRDKKILAVWRQHPGYGPSQIRNTLKRNGFRVSVGTARHVMESNGYLPPKLKRKEPVGSYEAGRPMELYHLDFYHFYVHKQKQCILFIEDDFSRFIAGWALVSSERADPVIQCFEEALQRYGRPDGVMSDRGSAFHSWRGLSRFESLLEELEVNYYLAKEASVNGKVEALNATFQKECVVPNEFMDLTDAARVIGRWVDHYNHHRTHHGLGGILVPADRFYGIAEQTLKRIEQGLGAKTADLTNPDSRGLELFRVVSYGGTPQVWLMGKKILE